MNIDLTRHWFTPKSTIGIMHIDGIEVCFTLEDALPKDGIKIPGLTCIPAGKYKVIMDMSTRFKCLMPHILNVPGFDGIRIHAGNTAASTNGCVLVGLGRQVDMITLSHDAFVIVNSEIEKAYNKKEAITLTILNSIKEN